MFTKNKNIRANNVHAERCLERTRGRALERQKGLRLAAPSSLNYLACITGYSKTVVNTQSRPLVPYTGPISLSPEFFSNILYDILEIFEICREISAG